MSDMASTQTAGPRRVAGPSSASRARVSGVVVEQPPAPGLAAVFRLPRPRLPEPDGPSAA